MESLAEWNYREGISSGPKAERDGEGRKSLNHPGT